MRLRYKLLIVLFPVLLLAIFGLVFSVQAKQENTYLRSRIDSLERITSPPKVNVLSKELSLPLEQSNYSISISKLIIEDLGLNTLVRAEVSNKSEKTKSYIISSFKPTYVQDSFKEITIDSSYIVTPLTDSLVIDAGQKKPIVILVSKLQSDIYENTEAWISVKEVTSSQIQSELVLRILIKP